MTDCSVAHNICCKHYYNMIALQYCSRLFRKAILMQLHQKQMSSVEHLTDVTFDNGVKTIKMCHAKTRNSLSIAMMENLVDNITRGQADPSVRVIIITGVGPIFSAGHNLKELGPNCSRDQHQQVFSLASKLMNSVIDSSVPVIARVDGLAAAAGCQLVAQCDLALCTEKSSFSTPGVNFGIFCSTPGIALGRCVPKNTAMQMLLTGQPLSSHEAKEAGLVNQVCTSETLDYEIDKMCEAIIAKSRSVVELGKRFFYKQMQNDIKSAYTLGEQVMVDNINMKDGQEGIRSFIEKRKPKWNH